MPTNLAIDDRLIEEARQAGQHRTKKEAVTAALDEYIRRRKQLRILDLFATIDYREEDDYKANRGRDEVIHTADHEYAARVYNECRNQGVESGTVDMLICAVAVRRGWEVLSGDGGLHRCLAVAKKFAEKHKRASTTEEVKTHRTPR